MDVWNAYLWVFENEFGRKISVQDAVEDDWHTQCEVEGGVDPRVVQRSARHCVEITEMQNGLVMLTVKAEVVVFILLCRVGQGNW